ncbi:hypothetical protein F4821DRAFT_206591 [Hypoxylon rubiginosum]|uniref:Uncharacterized protein n=1 Tax=Hypoxylon rubiginosum TaxID=110542 RepID=A0ACC0CQP3_9PEZI|nr:hypothetical protein F4821DRAFT_206591 [Hypoxylon rubiginosum]
MSSIGPQLPPRLTKRKRTPEDESPESPAAKLRAKDRAPTNQDEVDLSSDDEDSYGPSIPLPAKSGPIGPAMPPPNTDEVQLDDSDEDDIGPTAPPPPPSTRPSIGPTLPPSNNNKIPLEEEDSDDDVGPAPPTGPKPAPSPAPVPAKRVHGPAPPPAPLSERPPAGASDSDSDDDDYGPALPTSSSHLARQTQAQIAQAEAAAAAAAAGPKRDDWMLAPPPAAGPRAADPTKIKNRRFNSGPRANTSNDGGELSSIWTETPDQKRKRLENAVLGREAQPQQHTSSSGNKGSGITNTNTKPLSREEEAQQERIRSFTEATRGKSLYEEHRSSRQGRPLAADEEEDDPSARAFDKEKDMKLGGRVGTAQRRELLNRAADFGGRFAKGKYL